MTDGKEENSAGTNGLGLDLGVEHDVTRRRRLDASNSNGDKSGVIRNGEANGDGSGLEDITGSVKTELGNGRVMEELVNGESREAPGRMANGKRRDSVINGGENMGLKQHADNSGEDVKLGDTEKSITATKYEGDVEGTMTMERTAVRNNTKDSTVAGATLVNVLHDKPDPPQSPSQTKDANNNHKVQKLPSEKLQELTSSPDSLCLRNVSSDFPQDSSPDQRRSDSLTAVETSAPPISSSNGKVNNNEDEEVEGLDADMGVVLNGTALKERDKRRRKSSSGKQAYLDNSPEFSGRHNVPDHLSHPIGRQRAQTSRAVSTSGPGRQRQSSFGEGAARKTQTWTGGRSRSSNRRVPGRLDLDTIKSGKTIPFPAAPRNRSTSPVPVSIPIPPFSIPTYLQLELSSARPSPLYIHQSAAHDLPYESSRVMLERLQNFFLVPLLLEHVLWFGTLACIDSWLYTFTILPLRFCKAIFLLVKSWMRNLGLEARFISSYVVKGLGRMWSRRGRGGATGESNGKEERQRSGNAASPANSASPYISSKNTTPFLNQDMKNRHASSTPANRRHRASSTRHQHRRNRSIPSNLLPDDKADILKGLLMIFTCTILMYFDASRMYHWIRGQAAIKLYVIYNVLEVGDRLLSAIGQDVLECLFSQEALERKPDGRSKVLWPCWLFILGLIYTVIHATALFYQVMTLNVAVNSYSNALITLLLSNQFVEIKSTVFKKFEKENLFQLTCADVVERFQLWLMLIIIASRNFVETGGFNFGNALTTTFTRSSPSMNAAANNTPPVTPLQSTSSSILPQSFTLLLPSSGFSSLSSVNSIFPALGHLLGPFFVVLGSEMVVDWVKHAYINKFNNYRPAMYSRFLDILAKDYYTSAFSDQNLNRRLGLPIIPLSCLFFRVSVQTYQMFLTAWLPQLSSPSFDPSPSSNANSLSAIHSQYSSTPPSSSTLSPQPPQPSSLSSSLSYASFLLSSTQLKSFGQMTTSFFQTIVSHATPSPASFVPIFTVILILLLYITLLLIKLVVGMILLSYSRARYKNMKHRERQYSATSHANAHSKQSQPQSQPQSQSQQPATTTIPPDPVQHGNRDTVEGSRRVGGWGTIEVGDDRRRWIYADDPEGAKKLRDRDERDKSGKGGSAYGFENVKRYEMVAKRIW